MLCFLYRNSFSSSSAIAGNMCTLSYSNSGDNSNSTDSQRGSNYSTHYTSNDTSNSNNNNNSNSSSNYNHHMTSNTKESASSADLKENYRNNKLSSDYPFLDEDNYYLLDEEPATTTDTDEDDECDTVKSVNCNSASGRAPPPLQEEGRRYTTVSSTSSDPRNIATASEFLHILGEKVLT